MRNRRIIGMILLILIFGILIIGCAKDTEKPQEEPIKQPEQKEEEKPKTKPLTVKDVYPLHEGNYWKYAGEGNEYASFEQKVLFTEGDRIQLQRANGGTVMAMIYEYKDGKLMVVYSQEEFYEEENILDRESEMAQVILQEPIAVGTSWESADQIYTIEALDAVVQTPAGEFSGCIKVTNTDKDKTYQSDVYYKPGLGLIKHEIKGEDFRVDAELEKYDVKSFE